MIAPTICRPGFGASCALCCCSHNFRATFAEIDILFRRRAALLSDYSRDYLIRTVRGSRSDMTGSYYFREERSACITLEKRVQSAFQCPFVGYIDDERTVGCILYPEEHRSGMTFDGHQVYRSKRFTCRAHETMTPDDIDFAARLCGDWYFYGALIHLPELLATVRRNHPDVDLISFDARQSIFESIDRIVMMDDGLHRIDSYFG